MRTIAVCVVVLGIGWSAKSWGDLPPPEGYVERCTVANEQGPGAECVDCSAWHGERDKCDKEWGAKGYKKRCQTYGASAWTEVWCKGDARPEKPPATPAKPPAAKSDGGCDVGAGTRSAGGTIGGLAIAAIAAITAIGITWTTSRRGRRRSPSR